jgi:hypothetical protein
MQIFDSEKTAHILTACKKMLALHYKTIRYFILCLKHDVDPVTKQRFETPEKRILLKKTIDTLTENLKYLGAMPDESCISFIKDEIRSPEIRSPEVIQNPPFFTEGIPDAKPPYFPDLNSLINFLSTKTFDPCKYVKTRVKYLEKKYNVTNRFGYPELTFPPEMRPNE